MSKNNYRDIDRAEHRELMSLFEKSAFAFEKRYGAISIILDRFDLNLPPAHDGSHESS